MFVLDDSKLLETKISVVCHTCTNLIDGYLRKCKAFEKIPDEIWEGKNNHRKPYKGDNGIRFEPIN